MYTSETKYELLQRCLASLAVNNHHSPEIILEEIEENSGSKISNDEICAIRNILQSIQSITQKKQDTQIDFNLFENIINNISDSAIILNTDWKYLAANKAAEISFGYSIEYLQQSDASKVILTRCIDKLQRFSSTQNKEIQHFFDYVISQDGKIIPVELIIQSLSYQNEPAFLLIIKDITDRKETEREILRAVIGTEERERKRFAKDLHDGLGPLLSSLKLYLSAIERSTTEEKRKNIIQQVHEVINEAIRSIKEIANNISPHLLSNFGLVSAVKDICNKINGANTITIDFRNNCSEFRFDRNIETILFRIIEEMLNNTIKHAKANEVKLDIWHEAQNLKLKYEDNGIGFLLEEKLSSQHGGMGISNIFNRLRTINAQHRLQTSPGKGFVCEIEVKITH